MSGTTVLQVFSGPTDYSFSEKVQRVLCILSDAATDIYNQLKRKVQFPLSEVISEPWNGTAGEA